jgi:hypothetical protein
MTTTMRQLTNDQLETRIGAFLERKTDQLELADPLKNINSSTRLHLKQHAPEDGNVSQITL